MDNWTIASTVALVYPPTNALFPCLPFPHGLSSRPSMDALPFFHPFYSHTSSHSSFCHPPPRDNPFHVPLVIGVYAYMYLVWERRGPGLWLLCDVEKGLNILVSSKGWNTSIDDYVETPLPSSSMSILLGLASSIHAQHIIFVIPRPSPIIDDPLADPQLRFHPPTHRGDTSQDDQFTPLFQVQSFGIALATRGRSSN